jgi:hypothetical protein
MIPIIIFVNPSSSFHAENIDKYRTEQDKILIRLLHHMEVR